MAPVADALQERLAAAQISVLQIDSVASETAAIELANASEFGLGASIFSRDVSRAQAAAQKIKAGFVLINDLIAPTADPRMPFGGVKASGFGTTRGEEGLLEMTFPHAVAVRRAGRHAHLEEPAADDAQLFSSYLQAAHGEGWPRFRAARALISRAAGSNQNHERIAMKQVGIIGGGLGGLSAACVLAARGHQRDPFRA